MDYKITFNDVDSWIEACQGKSDMSDISRSSRTVGSSWHGTETFEGAIHLARFGWPDGSMRAKELSDKLVANLISATHHKTRVFKRLPIGGGTLLIAPALMGQPDPYVHCQKVETTKFIRIVAGSFVSSGVDQQTMIQRGVVIAALIDVLEINGYRVKLESLFSGGGYSGYNSNTRIILKHFQDSLDIDRITFFLAHPSAFRRICFSWAECQDADYRNAFGIGEYYYHPGKPEDTGDIYFPQATYGDRDFSTPESAYAFCMNILREHGVESERDYHS